MDASSTQAMSNAMSKMSKLKATDGSQRVQVDIWGSVSFHSFIFHKLRERLKMVLPPHAEAQRMSVWESPLPRVWVPVMESVGVELASEGM